MALETKTNVFEIHTKTLVKDRMHEKLLKWLFPLDSSWHPECQKKRVDGTNLKYLDWSSETATCRTLSTMEIQAQGNDSLIFCHQSAAGTTCLDNRRSVLILRLQGIKDENWNEKLTMGTFSQTSRFLECLLKKLSHALETVRIYFGETPTIPLAARESDIRLFIEHEIGGPNDYESDAMDEKNSNAISLRVIDSDEGMQEQTVLDREEALNPLPSNLDDAFAGTMERIERQTDSQFKLEAEAID
ncbi:hypothetical protein PABG_07326 [Paracoccidioides brasiliensis Pb03]|nr:hypothetical protein PABG_07326 [Paracoccidioides brasiliensis Pb03]